MNRYFVTSNGIRRFALVDIDTYLRRHHGILHYVEIHVGSLRATPRPKRGAEPAYHRTLRDQAKIANHLLGQFRSRDVFGHIGHPPDPASRGR
jgi:hypothetical protein